MKKNQDTLFSIKNEELKKERKFSLFILRALFILEILLTVLLLFGIAYFFNPRFFYALFCTADTYTLFILSIGLPRSLLKLWFLWKLQFLGCYTLGAIGIIIPFFNIFIFSDTSFWDVALHLVAESILLIASWRVHSFLRKQATETPSQEVDALSNSDTVSISTPHEDNTLGRCIEKICMAIEERMRRRPLLRYLFLFLLNAGIFIFCIQRVEFRFAELFTVRFSIAFASFTFGLSYLIRAIQEIVWWYEDIINRFKNK